MEDDVLRYDEMVERALRDVVRQALVAVTKDGLPGSHHFYLSFRTDAPGVDMPAALRAQHPEDLTIVLQHQYWDLDVSVDGFTVTVSFNQQPSKLTVPFAALLSFVDPSVNFGLQFNVPVTSRDSDGAARGRPDYADQSEKQKETGDNDPGEKGQGSGGLGDGDDLRDGDLRDGDSGAGDPGAGGADVVTLDNFRKK